METIAEDQETEYELDKAKKKYAALGHSVHLVQLERGAGSQGLGLSLAGHRDRNCMAVFVCGVNPTGAAYRAGNIQVGDEILENIRVNIPPYTGIPSADRQLFDSVMSNLSDTDVIFTDGSKGPEGCGGAFHHVQRGTSRMFKLSRVAIMSDLLSVLSAIGFAGHGGSVGPLMLRILSQVYHLRENGIEIKFYYVKNHVGIGPNETADQLVKQAVDEGQTSTSPVKNGGHRGQWKKGRVFRLHLGEDGVVRVVALDANYCGYRHHRRHTRLEVVEKKVNGVVLHGRCHLNASAIIKGLSGPIFKLVILRRKTAINDIAVRPITQFPVSLAEEASEESFSQYPNVRTITIKKQGGQSLGIMIIEGKHAEVGQGIFISDIQDGSSAEKAGLEIGEMILAVNKDSLLGSNYDTAANLLKRTEGLVKLVVSNPGKRATTPTPSQISEGDRKQGGPNKAGLKPHSGPPSRPLTPVPEPAADPSTCQIIPGKETTIEIATDNNALGIFFVGGKDTQLPEGIVVVEVYSKGAASKDGRLQPGDQLLEANGVCFRDATFLTTLQTLRQKLPKMKLTVLRPEKIDYQTIEVEFAKKPGKGIGISAMARNSGKGVYVSEILPGSSADIDGRIMKGDFVISVNNTSLENMSAADAGAVLKTMVGRVSLKLCRFKVHPR